MEFLNKIEIAGVVGRANLTPCGPTTVCNFSVMTEYCYKGNDGGVVVDTLWLSVTACGPKPQWPDLSQIQKGSKVHVIGRLRETTSVPVITMFAMCGPKRTPSNRPKAMSEANTGTLRKSLASRGSSHAELVRKCICHRGSQGGSGCIGQDYDLT